MVDVGEEIREAYKAGYKITENNLRECCVSVADAPLKNIVAEGLDLKIRRLQELKFTVESGEDADCEYYLSEELRE